MNAQMDIYKFTYSHKIRVSTRRIVDASEEMMLAVASCCPPISWYPFYAWTWAKHVSDQQFIHLQSWLDLRNEL